LGGIYSNLDNAGKEKLIHSFEFFSGIKKPSDKLGFHFVSYFNKKRKAKFIE
jgi:hypothetical protein